MVKSRTPCVLLVDDEPLILKVLRIALVDAGFKVVVQVDSIQALDSHSQGKLDIDLLVTDMSMPELGGVELASRMREKQPGLPVVFISGDANSAPTPTREISPENYFLPKPFLPSKLVSLLENHFKLGGQVVAN